MSTDNGVTEVMFYNHAGFGDIHLSRGLVRAVTAWLVKQGVAVNYAHNRGAELLQDIPGLRYAPGEHQSIDPYGRSWRTGTRVGINTWYCTGNGKFSGHYGLTFDCLYSMLEEDCSHLLGLRLSELQPDPKRLFPQIDWSAYPLANPGLDRMRERAAGRPWVLICNSRAMSQQATNFEFDPVLDAIAHRYPHVVFVCTNGTALGARENVLDAAMLWDASAHPEPWCNLNEISLLGLHAALIVGRSSGPYTYCFTQDHFFGGKARFLCSSSLRNPRWLGRRFAALGDAYTCQMEDIGEVAPGRVAERLEQVVREVVNG